MMHLLYRFLLILFLTQTMQAAATERALSNKTLTPNELTVFLNQTTQTVAPKLPTFGFQQSTQLLIPNEGTAVFIAYQYNYNEPKIYSIQKTPYIEILKAIYLLCSEKFFEYPLLLEMAHSNPINTVILKNTDPRYEYFKKVFDWSNGFGFFKIDNDGTIKIRLDVHLIILYNTEKNDGAWSFCNLARNNS